MPLVLDLHIACCCCSLKTRICLMGSGARNYDTPYSLALMSMIMKIHFHRGSPMTPKATLASRSRRMTADFDPCDPTVSRRGPPRDSVRLAGPSRWCCSHYQLLRPAGYSD